MSICMCMLNILHLGQWREQPLTYSYFPFSPQSSVRWNVDKKVYMIIVILSLPRWPQKYVKEIDTIWKYQIM